MLRSLIPPAAAIGPHKMPADGAWIEAIRINEVLRVECGGREFVVKRRRRGAGAVVRIANGFFRLARCASRVIVEVEEWKRWEIACFQLLNGDRFTAFDGEERSVFAERMPGQ